MVLRFFGCTPAPTIVQFWTASLRHLGRCFFKGNMSIAYSFAYLAWSLDQASQLNRVIDIEILAAFLS